MSALRRLRPHATSGSKRQYATENRNSVASKPAYRRGAGLRRCRRSIVRQAGRECRMADTEIIPVIDLGPYLAGAPDAIDRTAGELRFALTEIGFYFIVNHGVSCGLMREVFRQVARFHAQPLEKKLEIKLDKHNVGYLPMKGDTLRTSTVATVTKPNLNEALFVARDLPNDHPDVVADRRFRSANRWPSDLLEFREVNVDYCITIERLVQ